MENCLFGGCATACRQRSQSQGLKLFVVYDASILECPHDAVCACGNECIARDALDRLA